MANRNKNSITILALILIVVYLMFLVPALAISQESTKQLTQEQELDSYQTIDKDLKSIVDGINNQSINITVVNEKTGSSDSIKNISIDETKNLTLDNSQINITNSAQIDSSTHLLSYEYPNYLNWPDGAIYIIENIMMIILIVSILLIIVLIIIAFGGM